jgi:hypothetical protein
MLPSTVKFLKIVRIKVCVQFLFLPYIPRASPLLSS